ncbi:MAG: hypothetical protein ACR2PY_00095 [Salinispira sp.]
MIEKIHSSPVIFLSVLVFTGLFAGCNQRSEIISIATDIPEVTEYLEFVRTIISPPYFTVIFDDNPNRSTVLGDISPDIIISNRITDETFSQNLYPIPFSRLTKQSGAKNDHFVLEDMYPGSYASYRRKNTVSAFVLAFDLPIIYGNTEFIENLENMEHDSRVTYDQLLEAAENFTTLRQDIYSTMGFSSLRNILFIDLLIREHTQIRNAIPGLNELQAAMKDIAAYLTERTQDPEAQIYYNNVFAYSADNSSIAGGHLFSSLSSLHEYITDLNSRIFPYVWLYSEEQIEALNPIYIGITQNSRHKSGGIEILRGLLSARVQTLYLQEKFNSQKSFTFFLSHLSSNRIVNDYVIPHFSDTYTVPENIMFPGKPIFLWDEIKTQVYYPWIADNIIAPEISTDELYQSLESYYKLNSGYQ